MQLQWWSTRINTLTTNEISPPTTSSSINYGYTTYVQFVSNGPPWRNRRCHLGISLTNHSHAWHAFKTRLTGQRRQHMLLLIARETKVHGALINAPHPRHGRPWESAAFWIHLNGLCLAPLHVQTTEINHGTTTHTETRVSSSARPTTTDEKGRTFSASSISILNVFCCSVLTVIIILGPSLALEHSSVLRLSPSSMIPMAAECKLLTHYIIA